MNCLEVCTQCPFVLPLPPPPSPSQLISSTTISLKKHISQTPIFHSYTQLPHTHHQHIFSQTHFSFHTDSPRHTTHFTQTQSIFLLAVAAPEVRRFDFLGIGGARLGCAAAGPWLCCMAGPAFCCTWTIFCITGAALCAQGSSWTSFWVAGEAL